MRQFDFYEFAGIIVPGTVFLTGVTLSCPDVRAVAFEQATSLGESALLLIVAYGLGQLLAAFGNMIEMAWWWLWGGKPSDWPRSGKHQLIAVHQIELIDVALNDAFDLEAHGGFRQMSERDWLNVVQQIYATLAANGRTDRIAIFNGNYGLNRGLAAAFLAIIIIVAVLHGAEFWEVELLLVLGALLATYRMHRFGVHYARELFAQLLALQVKGGNASEESKE